MIRRFWWRVSGGESESLNRILAAKDDSYQALRRVYVESMDAHAAMASTVQFTGDFRRILADYNRSVLEAKSPAARGKLATPAFYAILEAARLHGIQPLGTESQGEQGAKERKEA